MLDYERNVMGALRSEKRDCFSTRRSKQQRVTQQLQHGAELRPVSMASSRQYASVARWPLDKQCGAAACGDEDLCVIGRTGKAVLSIHALWMEALIFTAVGPMAILKFGPNFEVQVPADPSISCHDLGKTKSFLLILLVPPYPYCLVLTTRSDLLSVWTPIHSINFVLMTRKICENFSVGTGKWGALKLTNR